MNYSYLDNNSTTPLDPQVLQKMQPYLTELYGNPNAKHNIGKLTHEGLEEASNQIYFSLNIDMKDTLIITSCATESINSVHHSILMDFLKDPTSVKKKIISSSIEHVAVLRSLSQLTKFGIEIIYLPVKDQSYTVDDFLQVYDPKQTLLVSLSMVNSETGIIHPLQEIAKICQKDHVLIHTDATQAVGKISVNLTELPVDYFSFSAHKFHGPKGIGGLIIKGDAPFNPLLHGGEQMGGFRAGTLNVASIVGLGEAIYKAHNNLNDYYAHTTTLRNLLEDYLRTIEHCTIIGERLDRIPNTTFFTIDNIDLDMLSWYLNQHISVSTGSACSSVTPSSTNKTTRGIRISSSLLTTKDNIEELIHCIQSFLNERKY